jgi:hypothetical protein
LNTLLDEDVRLKLKIQCYDMVVAHEMSFKVSLDPSNSVALAYYRTKILSGFPFAFQVELDPNH